MRSRRELGSRDRRFLSQAVFRHFRWMGWTRIALQQELPEAALLSALLEEPTENQWIQHLAQHITFPAPLKPLGSLSLEEKIGQINQTFQSGLSETHLITLNAASVIHPDVLAHSFPAFQHRPPTWIRSRIEPNELLDALATENIPAESASQHPQAIAIPSGIHLQQRLNIGPGQFIVQDLASQCRSRLRPAGGSTLVGLLCRLRRKIITSSRPDETTRRRLSQRSPRKRLSRAKKTRPHLRYSHDSISNTRRHQRKPPERTYTTASSWMRPAPAGEHGLAALMPAGAPLPKRFANPLGANKPF